MDTYTRQTIDIMSESNTSMLLRLKDNINDWLNEELNYLECEWDHHYAKSQKERIFRRLSGNR